MSEQTKIEWTEHTGGPHMVCSEVSAGCGNCYARELMLARLAGIIREAYRLAGLEDWKTRKVWGDTAPRVLTKGFWNDAIRINRKHAKAGTRGRWFPSMIDWLDEMPAGIMDQDGKWLDKNQVLADFLKVIHDTPNLDWLLLTKRPENFFTLVRNAIPSSPSAFGMRMDWLNGHPPQNVWLGTSVENQKCADERIPVLLKIPAKVRFLSVEPMLEAIHFRKGANKAHIEGNVMLPGIHWAIFGGESGPGARECRVDNIRNGIEQCQSAGVKVFVKQMGSNCVGSEMDKWVCRMKDKKGGNTAEWPVDLRVREFPL